MKVLRFLALTVLAAVPASAAQAQAELNDLEMAHVAVTASDIDIRYAHLALALSENPEVHEFARIMIRDHSAVNSRVAALARRLGVTAQDNPLSRQLAADAHAARDELSRLRGAAFDSRYAANELGYHRTVNGVVEQEFVPNIENAEVREAFLGALELFRGHERHAERLVGAVEADR